jgi:hypothetical protein
MPVSLGTTDETDSKRRDPHALVRDEGKASVE